MNAPLRTEPLPAAAPARPAPATESTLRALPRWLRFAVRNTLRNRRRSLATIGVAALGTAGILVGGGFALFTYESLAQAAARATGHLVVGTPAQFAQEEDTPLQHGLADVAALTAALQADPDVRHVLPRVSFTGLVSNGEKSTVMLATGVAPDAEFAVKGPFLDVREGEVLASGTDRAEVLVGEGLARSLKARPGTGLTLLATTTDGALNALDVVVRGVVGTGVPDVDRRLVYTDVATAQRLLGSPRVSTLGVFLRSMDATPGARARVAAAHPRLAVQTWQDQAFYYQAVRGLYNRIFGALGLIIAVIVLVVVANAMAMAIIERTREIGTLRALGTLPRQLMGSLALEGLVLGGTGALAGAGLALGIALLLAVVPVQMPAPPGSTRGYLLGVAVDPALYAGTLAAMVLLVTVVSVLVARRVVRLPVVASLAHT